jgi:hypothetical protein
MPYQPRSKSGNGSPDLRGHPAKRSPWFRGRAPSGADPAPSANAPAHRRSRLVESALWMWDAIGFVIELVAD